MSAWDTFTSIAGKVADYTPIVSNVKGAVQGNWQQAAGGPLAVAASDTPDAVSYIRAHPELAINPIGYGLDKIGIGPNAGLKALTGGQASIPGFEGGGPGLTGLTGLGGSAGSVNTGAITDAAAYAKQLADQYNGGYNSFQGQSPVGVSAGQVGPATMAAQQGAIQAGTYAGAHLAPTALAAQQAAIKAGQYGGATLAPVALAAQQRPTQAGVYGGAEIAPTQLAMNQAKIHADQIRAAQIDPTALADQSQQAEFRGGQQGLISGLNGAINGTDPSVAAIMLNQATSRNTANQYAMAQAAHGGNVGFAERQAMLGAADINQQSIGQQALLRAQEIATARGQLGGVLDQARGTDVGLALANQAAINARASQQAQLQQQAATTNAGNSLTADQTNAQLTNAIVLANANNANENARAQGALSNAAGISSAGNITSANTTTSQLANATALGNANNANSNIQTQGQLTNQAGIANAGNITSANTSSAQLANAIAIANANNQNSNIQTQGQLTNQAGIASANNITSANTTSSQLANAVQIANAQQANENARTQAGYTTQANTANATNSIAQQQANQTAQQNLASNSLTASGQNVTATIGAADAQAKLAQAQATKDAAYIGAGAATVASLTKLSDRTKKTDIGDGGHDVGKFLSDLSSSGAFKFRYKDPSADGAAPGQRFGIMAQDLEKNAMGRSLVHDTPGGKKVDIAQAALAALAALGAVNKRVEKIEARR